METLQFVTAIIALATALINFGVKLNPLKFKNMNSDHLIYYILLVAFILFMIAVCYLAKINLRK